MIARIPVLGAISLRSTLRVWWREFAVYSKTYKSNIIPNFFEPLVYLAGMGLGLGGYVREIDGMSYLAFIAPGLMASAAMNGAIFECTWNMFVRLHHDRVYDTIIATPCSPEDVACGEMLWAVTRSTIYGTAFLCVLLLFGQLRTPMAIPALLCMPLIGAMFATIATTFTGLIRRIDLYSYFYTLFVTPMFIFSGIFFPLDGFPAIVGWIAWATPLYHAVGLLRGLATHGPLLETAGHALWIVVCTAVLAPIAILRLKGRIVS